MPATPSVRHPLTAAEVEQRFLKHYQLQGYSVIPGSSLLDPSVPMSFVMSAGLAQVESSVARNGGKGNHYALVQSCFRYFDLEHIGCSPFHLSLFRMPGAFSFGPLRKQDSIARIWELLTEVYALPADALWATCFAGGVLAGRYFAPDGESYAAWQDWGVPTVGLGGRHNFWKQGATTVGKDHAPKCGPTTEVFFDLGVHLSCGLACQPGCGCGRFVEILNVLFITLHLDDNTGEIRPLAKPFTEIVVGAERIAMITQGVDSVFEMDTIRPLVEHTLGQGSAAGPPEAERLRHARILADHVRALLFLVADGAPPPGKGGRARLMRRLVRESLTAQRLLGIADSSFLGSLVDLALALYAGQQPQLPSARERVLRYVAEERELFERTLQAGHRRIERALARSNGRGLSGRDVLTFEKQHGIPLPLIEAMLTQRQVPFDRAGYQDAYVQWRQEIVKGSPR